MVASQTISATRRIAAFPDKVFEAWVNPALLQQWLSSIAEVDPRLGGHFRLEVSKPEGSHVVTGEYLEFVRGQRLVMTWVYQGPMALAGNVTQTLEVLAKLARTGNKTNVYGVRFYKTIV